MVADRKVIAAAGFPARSLHGKELCQQSGLIPL
jgi:hypothetical protein